MDHRVVVCDGSFRVQPSLMHICELEKRITREWMCVFGAAVNHLSFSEFV